MSNPFLILVKFTTRNRPQRFFDGMDNIFKECSRPDFVRVLVSADIDDPTMFNSEVRDRVDTYPNTEIMFGYSKNKIDAINRDMDKLPKDFKDWQILVNFSDDQRFTAPFWDDIIRADFNSVFPETLDGFMAYRDPDTHGALSTLSIEGRGFFNQFGFIYDPQFVSLFCDNLKEDCAKHLGKYHYTGIEIYRHFNPAYNYLDFPKDDMFQQQQDIGWDVDNKLYYKIKEEGIENYLKPYL